MVMRAVLDEQLRHLPAKTLADWLRKIEAQKAKRPENPRPQ